MPITESRLRVWFLHDKNATSHARGPEGPPGQGFGQAVPNHKEKAEVPWYDTST